MRRVLAAVAMAGAASPAVSVPVLATGGGRPPAARAASPTRYSLVHGCYSLRLSSGRVLGPFRMQAAALGKYLLYDGRFLQGDLTRGSRPSVWTVTSLHSIANGHTRTVSFLPASGCPLYPEAQVDAIGTPFTGATPAALVRGTVEGHAHITAFELFGGDWHCGRPWSPYGAPYALPASCAADEQGTNGAFEAFLDFGSPTRPSDMHGWPTFVHWPSPTAVAEEGDYYTAIQRASMAGLRLLVTNLVDNEALCSLMTTRSHPCNDMASVRIQSRDLYALQDYIDAQSGGPGKGWFRIVTDPFEARRVINQGKLAVIEGIEVSRIFGCGEVNGVPQCGRAKVDSGLKEIHKLGVRTFFPIHEFNNAFGGTKMIAGETGAIVNAGNRDETGSFWTLRPCAASEQDAPQLTFPATGVLAQLLNGPVATLLHGNPLPIYAPGPQCNVQGLTSLGAYLIGRMIQQHYIIQLDHMSSKTATAALAIAARRHYAGVVSAHCCNSPQLFGGIYKTGGFITEPQAAPVAFASTYAQDKAKHSARYDFGFGFGSDMNGLAEQAGPDVSSPIHYPFKSFDGRVTFTRERWGDRSFDLNKDGLANYGLYADWLQAVQQAGGRAITRDMMGGAEAYLEMWERAVGVPAERCLRARARRYLHLGMSFASLLYAAGQPLARSGDRYRYCTSGGGTLTAVFNGAGRVSRLVAAVPAHAAARGRA